MATVLKFPNVAGTFYDSDPIRLKATLLKLLADAQVLGPMNPRIIIAPHAGYIYSGPIAASAYKLWEELGRRGQMQDVVILAPTHYHHLSTIASLSSEAYQTPLGNISLNQMLIEKLVEQQLLEIRPEVFEREHALES
ncbi:MAG: AmmeMemoRadiSam system protein B [Bdellovibrio sp.]|nr:AmmeMemoRadiSam system protein B [Bdellovibrio sp.]